MTKTTGASAAILAAATASPDTAPTTFFSKSRRDRIVLVQGDVDRVTAAIDDAVTNGNFDTLRDGPIYGWSEEALKRAAKTRADQSE